MQHHPKKGESTTTWLYLTPHCVFLDYFSYLVAAFLYFFPFLFLCFLFSFVLFVLFVSFSFFLWTLKLRLSHYKKNCQKDLREQRQDTFLGAYRSTLRVAALSLGETLTL